MKSKTRIVLLLMVAALLLSGCAKLRVTTTVHPDGTGTNSFILALDTFQIPAGNIVWNSLNLNRRALEEDGAQVEDWEEGSYRGFKATFEFRDLGEMARQLTEYQLTEDYDYYGDSSIRIIFTEVESWFDEKGLAHFVARGDRTGAIDMGGELDFTLVMPGRIVSISEESAAEQREPDTVIWDLTEFDGREFELGAVSKVDRIPWAWILAVSCGGLIVLSAVVVRLVLLRARRTSHEGAARYCHGCGALVHGPKQASVSPAATRPLLPRN